MHAKDVNYYRKYDYCSQWYETTNYKGYSTDQLNGLDQWHQIAGSIKPIIKGFHIASAYGFYFPCDAEKSVRGKLRDQFGEMIIDHIDMHLPGFRELIVAKAIFSADHFATMEGATNGDWTHGLLHPEQMVGDRCLVEGTGHTTPVKQLFLCGSSCHPGPGVTFLPGYNCAYEILQSITVNREANHQAAPAPAVHAA